MRPSGAHRCHNTTSARHVPCTWRAVSAASRSLNRAACNTTTQPTLAGASQARAEPLSSSSVSWDAVYVGRMPLVGLETIVELIPQQMKEPLLLHTFVALTSSTQQHQCLILDFLPERPTDPATALVLASGGSVPGRLRVRHLKGSIGATKAVRTRLVTRLQPPLTDAGAQEKLQQVNRAWDPQLHLLRHDCRHYAAAVLSYITGTHYGIEDLA